MKEKYKTIEPDFHIFEYLYRDAANYKAFGQLLISGKIQPSFEGEIRSHLDCGEYFVAEQIDIPPLYSQLWKYSNGPTIADHAFHEFSELRPATPNEVKTMEIWSDSSSLLTKLRNINNQWDCRLSNHCSKSFI